jgi:hypothetical protein
LQPKATLDELDEYELDEDALDEEGLVDQNYPN